MPDREGDKIADTGMFRAFVEKGQAEDAAGRSPSVTTRVLGLLLLVAAVVIVGWLVLVG